MRVLSSIHPSNNQRRVLAKIIASPTPKVAGEQLEHDQNMTAARDALIKLGLVNNDDHQVTLTDKGTQLAQDENIIDQSGQLTYKGKQLASTNPDGQPDVDQEIQQQSVNPIEQPQEPFGALGDLTTPDANMPTERYQYNSLKKSLLNELLDI